MPSPLPRLLYLSAYPARDASGGSLLMFRHLARLAGKFEIHRAHFEPPLPHEENYHQLAPRPLFHRLARTRFSDLVKGLDQTRGFFHSRRELDRLVATVQPDVIATVAEDSLYVAVAAAARRARVPLVSVFHDWAPGWSEVPATWRTRADAAFRNVYRESAFALCVCDELREALGPKPESAVLHPIPDAAPVPAVAPDATFHALYAGAFQRLHAAEVKALCAAFAVSPHADWLRVIGPQPSWPADDARVLHERGFYRGFLKGAPFQQALAQAPVHLVTSPFGADYESYARYSFPSKIPEYCRFGRPILLWGPSYAASVRWARRTGAALVVDDPAPDAVLAALEGLHASPALRETFAARARHFAAHDFDPARLHAIFETGLARALRREPVTSPSPAPCPTVPAT